MIIINEIKPTFYRELKMQAKSGVNGCMKFRGGQGAGCEMASGMRSLVFQPGVL